MSSVKACIPASCPDEDGKPWRRAHLEFPSMITATCLGISSCRRPEGSCSGLVKSPLRATPSLTSLSSSLEVTPEEIVKTRWSIDREGAENLGSILGLVDGKGFRLRFRSLFPAEMGMRRDNILGGEMLGSKAPAFEYRLPRGRMQDTVERGRHAKSTNPVVVYVC